MFIATDLECTHLGTFSMQHIFSLCADKVLEFKFLEESHIIKNVDFFEFILDPYFLGESQYLMKQSPMQNLLLLM